MTTLTTKKKLLIALCTLVAVAAIVVTTIVATVAYLTSSAAVSNVFTIGSVGITMTESKVNSDGTLFDGGATQVDTNTYHLVPDKTYVKDPHINVAPLSEASYLFVLVRNDLADIANPDAPSIADQMASFGWAKYTKAATGWVYVYVGTNEETGVSLVDPTDADKTSVDTFTYTAKAVKEGTYYLFENFTVANVDEATLKKYGAAKITLTAVAIQQSGFESLDAAWAAVIETYPYIHTGTNS
jgi:predicted ribosomally synthesized peptide with SipW-like signal peptide